jgi:lipopolysaccharide export system permease protein
MYILTRYVIWEVLKYFLAALVALTLIVTPVMVIKEGLGHGFPPMVMLRIMPFTLPEMLGITIPASMLFSVCSVFGRMTGANEVVALKSLGISPMAVVWPAIVLAAFLSLGTVWMYELAATWCKPKVLQIGVESIEEIAYSMLQKNRSFDNDRFTITVKRVDSPLKPGDKPRLIQPTITIKGPPRVRVSATEATLCANWAARRLQIECTRGEFDWVGRGRMLFSGKEPEVFSVEIPEPDWGHYRYHRDWVALRNVPKLVGELQTTVAKEQADLRQLEQQPQANAEQIGGVNWAINEHLFQIRRLKTEPYRRWANGFTCLCFALLGIPVAMLWRHADVLTNFFVCFLPILAIYYPLLMLSDDLSTSSGRLPPISFWSANVLLATPAIGLLRQIIRH